MTTLPDLTGRIARADAFGRLFSHEADWRHFLDELEREIEARKELLTTCALENVPVLRAEIALLRRQLQAWTLERLAAERENIRSEVQRASIETTAR